MFGKYKGGGGVGHERMYLRRVRLVSLWVTAVIGSIVRKRLVPGTPRRVRVWARVARAGVVFGLRSESQPNPLARGGWLGFWLDHRHAAKKKGLKSRTRATEERFRCKAACRVCRSLSTKKDTTTTTKKKKSGLLVPTAPHTAPPRSHLVLHGLMVEVSAQTALRDHVRPADNLDGRLVQGEVGHARVVQPVDVFPELQPPVGIPPTLVLVGWFVLVWFWFGSVLVRFGFGWFA